MAKLKERISRVRRPTPERSQRGDSRESFRDVGRDLTQSENEAEARVDDRAGADHDSVAEEIDRDSCEDGRRTRVHLSGTEPSFDVGEAPLDSEEAEATQGERSNGNPRRRRT
ncbi:MAG: hypothetical protein ACJLS2_14610 [Microcella pacifica]